MLKLLKSIKDRQLRTKSHWDQLATEGSKKDLVNRTWGGLVNIANNHNSLTTGDPGYYWIDYMIDKYFPNKNAGNTLSLGCGEGFIERLFKERGLRFDSITGIDLSEKCIQAALERAHENNLAQNINYFCEDLNAYVPTPNSYNFIFFYHSLHHVTSLNSVLSGCAKALLSDGIMMINEFVGPTRFQWTDLQIEQANSLLKLIPEELRYDLRHKSIKEEVNRPSVEKMIEIDESEAVRSSEIEDVLQEYFEVIEEKNWGGTLNNLIFENIAGNFDEKNPYHKAIIQLLIHHENVLIDQNVIPSDFKFFMLKAKK